MVEAVIPPTGRPVQFVRVPDDGVPRTGVVKVGLVKVLFVSVSVVALPTNVSVEVGSVRVPVLEIEEITGVVRVLLVRVWVSTVVTSVLVLGIVVPLIVDEAVMAPVTPSVPDRVVLPVTPSVPPTVAFPVTGKLEAVPALITLESVTFFKAVAEASYIRSRSLA